MWLQFIDRRTRSERAVAVEICNRGGAILGEVDAIEGVRASSPLHKRRRRRRPGVLHVLEVATIFANYEVQIACASHKIVQSQFIDDGHGLSVPSLSKSASAGRLTSPTSMPPTGFVLPVLCTNAGAVDVPVFST